MLQICMLVWSISILLSSFWPTWDASALPKKIYLVLSRILSRTWHHDGWKHTARNIQRRMAGNCWRTHAILEHSKSPMHFLHVAENHERLSSKDLARLKTEGQLWPSPKGCMGCRFLVLPPSLSGCMQNANCDIHVTTSKGRHHVHAHCHCDRFMQLPGKCSCFSALWCSGVAYRTDCNFQLTVIAASFCQRCVHSSMLCGWTQRVAVERDQGSAQSIYCLWTSIKISLTSWNSLHLQRTN